MTNNTGLEVEALYRRIRCLSFKERHLEIFKKVKVTLITAFSPGRKWLQFKLLFVCIQEASKKMMKRWTRGFEAVLMQHKRVLGLLEKAFKNALEFSRCCVMPHEEASTPSCEFEPLCDICFKLTGETGKTLQSVPSINILLHSP